MPGSSESELLEKIWWAGVDRVNGHEAVRITLSDFSKFTPTHVAGVGKAASPMMRAALDAKGKNLPSLLVTKYDHAEEAVKAYLGLTVIEAAHPVPDSNSLAAGKALSDFVDGMNEEAEFLFLVSGGASSLAEALPDEKGLEDLQSLNDKMLAEGLDIHAINKQRKEISLIKGSKLLARFRGKKALVLLVSDVEGDDISIIGSGIGEIPEKRTCSDMNAKIIASNAIARKASEDKARELGIETVVNQETLYGDIFKVAAARSEQVRKGPNGLYIFGGEPTTILPENPGEGGRNQALALAMAKELSGENVCVLVGGTDGSDGPTKSAGGFVTGADWEKFGGGEDALARADSGSWLRKSGGLFVTGPTGTNVMDLMLVLKNWRP